MGHRPRTLKIKSLAPSFLGLVLSYPEAQEDRGTICVKVNWLGYELEEYYSVQHLAIVSEGK